MAYPSSEHTTTGRSDLTCVFTYEFFGGKLHEVPCFNDSYSWIIIQRRYDGSTSFYRNWTDYENGFGSVTTEIWLGNQYIHELTTVGYNILRIELTSFAGEVTQIEYDFSIDDKASNYRLHISERGVSGLNSLETSDLALFCTYDKDNDNIRTTNCAELSEHASGWWHSKAAWCTDGNLNGIYTNEYKNYQQGVYWFAWDKQWTLKETKTMLRKL
ncbi:angiopoietin-related protein 7-like [Crassostrea angulata]|uniref:angiopoietin-related protein 7-like n=1 Tax=Magallana angulata TaxID=2784310 RepID=UPI0022B08D4E|nr:angiopoietin-related protein 7-like [Crassostrea angulata]